MVCLAILPPPPYPHPTDMPMAQHAVKPRVVLTIAGFDPSCGAGSTADLQVFATHGLFGTACLTAITVQSTLGVTRVEPIDPGLLREMLDRLTRDMPPAGVKIGMLGSAAVVRVVADFLESETKMRRLPVVVDPVLRSSSGAALLDEGAVSLLLDHLLPIATCITPNRQELAALLGLNQLDTRELPAAARELLRRTGAASVIVTGGEETVPMDLLLEGNRQPCWLAGEHVETMATHGTGCAFSSALLSQLVLGEDLAEAACRAKRFVENGLRNAPGLGSGKGPMKLSAAPFAIPKIT